MTGYGEDALQPGYTGNENNDPQSLHRPYVRHVHTGWHRDKYGRWESDTWDDALWEVICAKCGDDEGPADQQKATIQKLRGPYPSHHKAEHAAHLHEKEANPGIRWTSGSTVPPQARPAPW